MNIVRNIPWRALGRAVRVAALARVSVIRVHPMLVVAALR